jgi:predicted metal-dependent hydrolase
VSREIVLTMPPRGSIKQARLFAQKHGAWIAARLARLPQTVPLIEGSVIPLRGVGHRIVHRRDARGTVWTEMAGNGEPLICVAGGDAHVARRLRDYLKREAKADLDIASRRAAASLGVAVKRVSVRDQSSRWGSCSSTGVLSYSWRLILAPPFVLDYLAAHEAAHLVEMNHSRRFWRLVENIYPETAKAKAWLNAHGADLHRYALPRR